MPTYKVAHLREQGQDMIIFPLESSYGRLTDSDQIKELQMLEFRAHAAGLAGTAVAVWDAGSGRLAFRGPTKWQPFLRGLSLHFVHSNINKDISW
jgi:hypothetical protein